MEYIKELRSIAASMNHAKFEDYLSDTLLEYFAYVYPAEVKDDTLTTFIVDSLAHYWGYTDSFNAKFDEFSFKYENFIKVNKKRTIVDTITKAHFARCKQDDFLKKHEHIYIVSSGVSSVLKDDELIEIDKENFVSNYPRGAFRKSSFFDKLELETLATLEEVTKILDPSWCIIMKIRGSSCIRSGRDFGLEPCAYFATAKTDGYDFYDRETCHASCTLPVSLELFFEMAEELESLPDERFRSPQFCEMKRIVCSHYLKEDLNKRLPVRGAADGKATKI
jgi:hypothetical protein